jgi:hypothetical protein
MNWPALLVTFGSMFAVACGSASSPSAPSAALSQPTELSPGQTAQVGPLRITFTGVSGDSRCPVDVVCVWAGDAVAKLSVSQPTGAVETRELHTSNPRAATYGDFQIELVRLDPAPHSTQPIPPASYRLVVLVTPVS